jgi:hypothetical protein
MAEIALINSTRTVQVDDEDLSMLAGYVWWEHTAADNLSYAYGVRLPRRTKSERIVKMHRLLLGLTVAKILVDHIDGDGLNNRKSNLAIITTAQNIQKANFRADKNKRKVHSKFRGVSYLGWYGKYLAYINCNGKREYLGYFATEEEAARARDVRAKELHGPYARLNYEDN